MLSSNWKDKLRPILARKIKEAISEMDFPFPITDDKIHLMIAITGIAMLEAMENIQKHSGKQNGHN